MNQKRFLVIGLMLIAFTATNSLAQNSPSAKNDASKTSTTDDASQPNPNDFVELLRKDVRSQKKQIIAENMASAMLKPRSFGRSTIDMRRSSPESTTRNLHY